MAIPASRRRAGTDECHGRAVERVIHAMYERIADPFNLDQMAHMAYMSRFHFNRTFRRVTGVPPRHFLGALRLEAARRMLVTSSASVTDICFSVGYNSLGTFVRRFTTMFGVSPRQLRQIAAAGRHPEYVAVTATDTDARCTVRGLLDAPIDFTGLAFIGLFRSALPENAPVACAIVRSRGTYAMNAPHGTYYLFSMGITVTIDPRRYLLYESALRAGGQRVTVSVEGVRGPTDLRLRAPQPTDPPILLTLPVLLRRATRSTSAAETVPLGA